MRPASVGGMSILIFVFVFVFDSSAGDDQQLLVDLDRCMQLGLPDRLYICDVDELLNNRTTERLNELLLNLKNIECQCADRELCYKNPADHISSAYTGILFVTTSDKIVTESINATAELLYRTAGLGRPNCNNGLLIIYAHDTRQLFTYRGPVTYGLLTDDDVELYEQAAWWHNNTNDEAALEFVLEGYQRKLDQPIKAETWAPIIGLTVAIVVVLFVAALIAVLCCGRCCVTGSRHKRVADEQLYPHVTGSYTKNVEPVYIVTDANSEHATAVSPDGIYSTPYSGTPQPRRSADRFVPSTYPPYLDPRRPKETQTKEDFLE